MSGFTALNIIPDDHSDDEVDNTKELQIEDALKLYQAALKLHAQGPTAYQAAALAYTALFSSPIFQYPESKTFFTRIDENPELELIDPAFPLELDLADGGVDGGPSTLPQILYLSYKNHGQFILDCLKSQFQLSESTPMDKQGLDYQAEAAIANFALALASDAGDTELWRRAARIGAMLGSQRIARYCLESAVEGDDDPTVAEVDPRFLEEGFAGEQLKELLNVLSDEMALSHPVMKPFLKKTMAPFLKKHADPYSFLPDTTKLPGHRTLEGERVEVIQRRTLLECFSRSWTGLGDALCGLTLSPKGLSAAGLLLVFPNSDGAATPVIPNQPPVEDQIMKDAGVTESPTVESAIATPVTAKSDDQAVVVVTTTTTVPLDGRGRSQSTNLPNRKRSQSAAGIHDTPEEDSGTQKRSKRIRNRDNTSEVDPVTQYAEQLQQFVQADESVFTFVDDLLKKLGVHDMGTFPELQVALTTNGETDKSERIANTAVRDLRDILKTWDDSIASVFLNANAADVLGSSTGGANAGLAAFLEHSKAGPLKISTKPPFGVSDGLADFSQKVVSDWMPLQDAVYQWLCIVLQTYRGFMWPEDLKVSVVRIISFVDPDIYGRIQLEFQKVQIGGGTKQELAKLEEMVETLFELHIDIYSRITNPASQVHYETRVMTKERLDRWACFAADVAQSRISESMDELSLRYLWASVFYATMFDDVPRDHKVLCWSDLQSLLDEAKKPALELQNNAVMPEISIAAAEREVSRLTTMDFFYNLFQTDTSDPMAIIQTLEPVLDPPSEYEPQEYAEEAKEAVVDSTDATSAGLRDMWKFLKTGSTSLRLFLWQRLREAYFSIGANTKVFSCYLKSIEIIVADLRTLEYVESAPELRHHQLLLWLKALDDLLVRSLTIALNDAATCFEMIDERHLKTTCTAIAQLNRVLHSAAIFDDEVRVGMTQLPQNPAYAPQGSFNGFINKLREMQVRTWALQYTMVKEAMTQDSALLPDFQHLKIFHNSDKDLADFLALVHYTLGLRKCCKASNKIFLKMMKVEMIRLKQVDKWEDYLGQVLYDLYGIKLGVGTYLLEEHGCPTEALDRRTVLNIAEQVIVLANRMPMKDLLKHELRATIERMQTAIGPAKSTPQMQHNLRNLTEYIRNSIRPLQLYQALRGQVEIDSVPVVNQDSGLADNGWYFLQGMIALAKFRSQKRLGPGGQTDDMRVSATFMRLQLQYNAENWEAWYRLAQCFDYELEDEVMWNADKVNNHTQELIRLQRGSIHCYIMALSTSVRTADASFETAAKLSELYHEFGMRIYSSSRDPLSMRAFWVDGFDKHMSGSAGMYKKPLHEELSRYKAWKYASTLFKRSLADRPNYWMNHFMIGKCLWKMFTRAVDEWDTKERANKPSVQSILNAFVNAIKCAPKQKDIRQEPILEPHYKLVSVAHKFVAMKEMEIQAAADLLQQQPYAINKGQPVVVKDFQEWEKFVLESFRHLRNADKQHWHHRMVSRVADIIYDNSHPDHNQALEARSEFRESIFTKTMHIQVWKPDAERPGRHCVYMSRYVRAMFGILWTLNDKQNMEQLARRVRKKSHEFFKFSEVWNECCAVYLRLIRRAAQIPLNLDELFKSVPADEFEIFSDRLTTWISNINISHPALEALRDAIELKKLNANQMKSASIDDLINDAWAALYTQVAKTLPSLNPPTLHQAQLDGASAMAPPPAPGGSLGGLMNGPMSLNNLVMNMDGTPIPVPLTIASSSNPGEIRSAPRKIGVSRREVLRRAEGAITRAPDPPRALAPQPGPEQSMILGSNDASASGDVGSNGVANGSGNAARAIMDRHNRNHSPNITTHENGNTENNGVGGSGGREDSSAPGSLHDSADDESDLSDVPDMDDAEIIFPNLMRGTGGSSGETS